MRHCILVIVLLCAGVRAAYAYPDGTGNDIIPYNVGIGTSAPKAKLQVDGAIYAGLTAPSHTQVNPASSGHAMFGGNVEIDGLLYIDGALYGDGSHLTGVVASGSNTIIQDLDTNVYVIDGANARVGFAINGSNSMMIDQNGNIGIGTSSPRTKLEMNNAAGFKSEYDNGNSGAAATIAWPAGNKQKITLTAATVTLTFTSPGVVGNIILEVIQDGTGGRAITWPGTVKWPGGSAPSLTGSAAAVDVVSFFYNGTVYYGNASFDYR